MNRLEQLSVRNKIVLVRCSINVPISEKGEILDDFRLQKTIPTIAALAQKGAKVVLLGHLGRPKGREKRLSLKLVVPRLQELFLKNITFVDDCVGEKPQKATARMRAGDVILLENLRFHKGEVENDEGFARELAELGDMYVNNAFDVSHREHASVVTLPRLLPSAIGLFFEQEILALRKIKQTPKHPFLVIIGGAKVKTKIKFLLKIVGKVDHVLLGNLMQKEVENQQLRFPDKTKITEPVDGIPDFQEGWDIGPQTINMFKKEILHAKTIFWTGPLGRIEQEQYQKGSLAIANAVLNSNAFSVAGGGDLSSFLGKQGLRERFDHVSTGGGALLAFLSDDMLPGLSALQ